MISEDDDTIVSIDMTPVINVFPKGRTIDVRNRMAKNRKEAMDKSAERKACQKSEILSFVTILVKYF